VPVDLDAGCMTGRREGRNRYGYGPTHTAPLAAKFTTVCCQTSASAVSDTSRRVDTTRQTTIKFTVAVGVYSLPSAALIDDISTAFLRRRPAPALHKYRLRPSQRNL